MRGRRRAERGQYRAKSCLTKRDPSSDEEFVLGILAPLESRGTASFHVFRELSRHRIYRAVTEY